MKSKMIFNSVIFFLAGIISLIRAEEFAIIVSFSFALVFFIINIFAKNGEDTEMIEQYD